MLTLPLAFWSFDSLADMLVVGVTDGPCNAASNAAYVGLSSACHLRSQAVLFHALTHLIDMNWKSSVTVSTHVHCHFLELKFAITI